MNHVSAKSVLLWLLGENPNSEVFGYVSYSTADGEVNVPFVGAEQLRGALGMADGVVTVNYATPWGARADDILVRGGRMQGIDASPLMLALTSSSADIYEYLANVAKSPVGPMAEWAARALWLVDHRAVMAADGVISWGKYGVAWEPADLSSIRV